MKFGTWIQLNLDLMVLTSPNFHLITGNFVLQRYIPRFSNTLMFTFDSSHEKTNNVAFEQV